MFESVSEERSKTMKKATSVGWTIASAGMLLCIALFVIAQPRPLSGSEVNSKTPDTVHLIPSLEGPDLYKAYCATCHGLAGKGDGPVASALEARPSDLTTIAKRHGGVFPVSRMRTIIAGDELILAHGTRDMPIWGPIFHQVE